MVTPTYIYISVVAKPEVTISFDPPLGNSIWDTRQPGALVVGLLEGSSNDHSVLGCRVN